jgi:GNAT superfamily N-acetyltransferase
VKIAPLCEQHLEDAAALACARYRVLRGQMPCLPARYECVDVVLPELRELTKDSPAVAAFEDGRLVGFLGAWLLRDFRGAPAAFSPEWGNGAALDDSRRTFQELYTAIAERWAGDGYRTHLISTPSCDREGIDGWHWLGFGGVAVDAVRELDPLSQSAAVEIRRATPDDVDAVVALGAALQAHMAASPTFMSCPAPERSAEEEWLADTSQALWLAYEGDEAVGCLRQGPANPGACEIVQDEGTTSVAGTITLTHVRGRGIAGALLDRALAWGRQQGYARCAVDFEPMNPLAVRFWMRHFRMVSYTVMRRV